MKLKSFSSFGNIFFILGIACFYFIISNNPILPIKTLRILFICFGALGIILNLLQVKEEGLENSNLLHWIGSLIVFIGLIGKTLHIQSMFFLIIIGLGITGISYFYNPFSKKDKSNSELLDE
ncbi:MAG: hypothetical protein ACK476_09110 [Fluviicola sp.]|jgi:hypothetical protein